MSEPVASDIIPVASATADPPEEPPAFRSGSNALPVAPQTGLRVLAPAPNSGVFVLQKITPPAARTRPTIASSFVGT